MPGDPTTRSAKTDEDGPLFVWRDVFRELTLLIDESMALFEATGEHALNQRFEAARAGVSSARSHVEEAVHRAERQVDSGPSFEGATHEHIAGLEEIFREHPLQSLVVAVGGGIVLGLAFSHFRWRR